MLGMNLRIRPIINKFCNAFRTFPKPNPPLRTTSPRRTTWGTLFAGNLVLCCNTLKYRGRLVMPNVARTSAASAIGLLLVGKEETADLESYVENDAREDKLLTAPGSLWMRFRMTLRVFHLAFIFLPVAVTSPLLLIFHPQSVFIRWWWGLLRFSLEHAGACWIKFGQWASTRPDLFPVQLCQQLSFLHSSCPSHRGSLSIKIISKELKKNIDDLFFYFDPVPIASGSIAQVHKGVLYNGRVVAVKVLHPRAYRTVQLDFRILYSFVKMISKFPTLKWLSLHEGVLEFGKSMVKQLDLRREAYNLARFRKNFKSNNTVVFPAPLHARQSVLIETFEPGEPIAIAIKQKRVDNTKLASMGFNAYLKMMLIDNFTHSDLHPGNILVRQSPLGEPQLVFLDVGLVTELSPRDRKNFLELFEAVVKGDGRLGAELMVRSATDSQCQGECLEHFKEEMGRIFANVQKLSLGQVRVGQIMTDVLTTVRNHYVKVESNFATLVMGTMVLEGLGKQLDPNLNLIKEAMPYFIKEEVKQFFSFQKIVDKFRNK